MDGSRGCEVRKAALLMIQAGVFLVFSSRTVLHILGHLHPDDLQQSVFRQ
jgi:hypothetical protein